MSTSGTTISIPPRLVRMTPSDRRSRRTRTTTSRTDPTASASACWLTRQRADRLPLLGGEIEQVPGDALPDRREGAARDLRDEIDDSLTELVDDRPRHAKVALGQADHDVGPEADEIRVDQCLDRRGEGVAGREQGDDARQLAAAEVADRQAPTVGCANEDAKEAVDEELEIRAGFADLANGRARRRVDPRGAFEERRQRRPPAGRGDANATGRPRPPDRPAWPVPRSPSGNGSSGRKSGSGPHALGSVRMTAGYRTAPILVRRRHSSVVEQLFRKQQVLGSSPSVGSTSRFVPGSAARLQACHAPASAPAATSASCAAVNACRPAGAPQ